MRPARLALAVVFVLTACVAVLHAVERWQLTTQLRFEEDLGGGVLFRHVFHFEDIFDDPSSFKKCMLHISRCGLGTQ